MIKIIRFFMRVFWLFRLNKKKIFFSAYEGKQFSCNPKEIYNNILGDTYFDDFMFVWEANSNLPIPNNSRTKIVRHNTLKYFFEVMTSKYIITNSGITGKIPIKKQQVNINTWHGGGAYKRVGLATKSLLGANYDNLYHIVNQTTYFISSSRIFTNVMAESLHMPNEKFLEVGMPRNDIFFQPNRCVIVNQKVRNKYDIDENDFVVLYAPTYRGSIGEDKAIESLPDFKLIKDLCNLKFGKKTTILIRAHYFNNLNVNDDQCISVSDYPEMQDLLVSCDMLITDYSSSMWDFALTYKPCLLYMPDYKEYDAERGFYTSVETWPGMLCFTNNDIKRDIEQYDKSKYKQRIMSYLDEAGNYDKGEATSSIISILKQY